MPDLPSVSLAAWFADCGLVPDPVDFLLFDESSAAFSGPLAVVDDHTGALAAGLAELAARAGASVQVRAWQDSFEARARVAAAAGGVTAAAGSPAADDGAAVDRAPTATTPDGAAVGAPSAGVVVADSLAQAVAGATLVVGRLPKSLDRLEEYAQVIAAHADPAVRIILAGRIKHMTLGMNDVLARHFPAVSATRARQKSRALVAAGPHNNQSESTLPIEATFPRSARVPRNDLGLPGTGQIEVAAHGGVFAGAKIDIGTRLLLRHLSTAVADAGGTDPALPDAAHGETSQGHAALGNTALAHAAHGDPALGKSADAPRLRVVDAGCGTGLLSVAVAELAAGAIVLAFDDSQLAVTSTRETARRAGRLAPGADDPGVMPVWTSAAHLGLAADLTDWAGTTDLVVCNPPFHVGAGIDASPAYEMFAAAGRLLRPGGQLWTVFNRHLGYVPALTRDVGPTTVVAATPKFVVTRSVRREP